MCKKIELMSPAGDWASLQAALENGADSVYFGVDHLNMRARSTTNFKLEDLENIVTLSKKKFVRTYLTMNTIIYDHDLSIMKSLINTAKKVGIDAIIAMDQAIIQYAHQIGMAIHISTQLNITNIESIKFYSIFSNRIVLSRELSLNQIQKIVHQIKKNNIIGPSGRLVEIEIFGHGALCMAISGKCYLSLHSKNSSANRGSCQQNCRKKYTLIDQESGFQIELDNEYMMSSKDLCTISFLDQIIIAGIKVLKIEGRGRSPEYVATTTSCYREAIDAIFEKVVFDQKKISLWMKRLHQVYNRGFWNGYYLGQELGEWSSSNGSLATQKKLYLGKVRHYYPQAAIGELLIEAYDLNIGDTILIIGPSTGVREIKIYSIMVDRKSTQCAIKGQICSIPINFKLRNSDKIYKLIQNKC